MFASLSFLFVYMHAVKYSPPEIQREQWLLCGRKSDMWSFGCLMLELCTGSRLPSTWGQLKHRQDTTIVDMIKEEMPVGDHVDPWIMAILYHSLHM